MKIAILSRYQKTANRGVESVVTELAQRLSKNHQADILSGSDADNLSKVLSGHYQIVMPTNGRWQSLKMSLGRFFSPYKLVIGGHSGIGRDDIWNIVIAKPDVFVALTGHMASWAKKWAWGSRVVTINNGIDLQKFNSKGERFDFKLPGKIVLSVGALSWYKNHHLTIEAVSRLGNVSLVIVGKGEEEEKLKKLGQEKLGERFKLISVDYDKIPLLYRGADLFTLPSWDREAFGVVYLEAMASNLPVVAPEDDSRREIVGEGGVLVDCTNIEKFSKALAQALQTNFGDKPRKQAEKFSWEQKAKEYEDLFEQLVKEKL